MADALFEHPRLAEIYDFVDSDRSDLLPYLAMVEEVGAESVLDIGCGTGSFATLLAQQGRRVVGVDPAVASLDVARRKPFADRVQWVLGDATALPPLEVDLVTMTGNVAQVFLDDEQWDSTLRGSYAALRDGGLLAFEVRDPARKAWEEWTRDRTIQTLDIPGHGRVETWVALTNVDLPFVSFRSTYIFGADGAVLHSDSTLRFRDRSEIERTLTETGFVLEQVRDAPDRPGKEFVFLARKSRE